MSAREIIVAVIAVNKPSFVALPVTDIRKVSNYEDLIGKFSAMLESIGGKVIAISDIKEIDTEINRNKNEGKCIINGLASNDETIISLQKAVDLESIDIAYIEASIGVAENGAVWVKESQMKNRLLPFICQHLVVVLEKNKLVATMHHAYLQVNVFEEGFGVFIAGPSKTADIEQSLVIGAHGARSMTVYLLD